MKVLLSSVPLVVAPLLVLLAAFVSLVATRGVGARPARLAGRIVTAGMVGAWALLLFEARPLLAGARVLSHALRLFRVGSLDANLSFWLDPTSLALSSTVLVGGAILVSSRPASGASPRALSAIGVGTAALLLATLGDGFASLSIGWIAFGVIASVTLGARAPKSGARAMGWALSGAMFLAVGAGMVFWGLGGRYLDGRRYLSDYRAPFEVSSKPPGFHDAKGADKVQAPKVGEKSYLTMTTHPGAKIYLGMANESQLSRAEPFAVAPVVRAELPAGLQKVAIDSGGGTLVGGDGREVALIEQARFPAGEEVVIRALGPTLTFREIDAQLEKSPTSYAERQLGTLRILDVACLALGLGALGLALGFGRAARDPGSPVLLAFSAGGAAIVIGVLGARTSAVFAASSGYATLVACVALLVSLHAALRGSRALSGAAFLADAARGSVALVVAVAATSNGAAAVAAAIATAFGLAALAIPLEQATARLGDQPDRLLERGAGFGEGPLSQLGGALTLGIVTVAGSPVPLAGTFLGLGALGMSALSRGSMGWLVAAAGAAAWGAMASNLYRGYFCLLHTPANNQPPTKTDDPPLREKSKSAKPDEGTKTSKSGKASKKARTEKASVRGAPHPSEASTQVMKTDGDAAVPRDRLADLAALLGAAGGPVAAFALGALDFPADQTTTARALAVVVVAIPAAITGHLARKRYGAERAADWVASEQTGPLTSFGEPEVVGEEAEPSSKISDVAAVLDRALSAPLGSLTAWATPRDRAAEEDA